MGAPTKGFFQGARSIEFWVKTDAGTPDVLVNIGADQVGAEAWGCWQLAAPGRVHAAGVGAPASCVLL